VLPAVRVLAPGRSAAKVTVSVVGENGQKTGTSTTATVQAGIVQELPLDKLVDGSYTVTVTSDQPIVAAARTTDIRSGNEDFGWFAAASALTADTIAAVAPGTGAALHLTNPGTHDVQLTVPTASGDTQVTVPADGAVSVPIARPGVARTLNGTTGLIASVGYVGAPGIASYVLAPPGPRAQPITVYPR